MKVRHQFDQASTDAASLASAFINTEPSLTLQGPAAEADLNNIVKTYGHPGLFPVPPQVSDPAYYGDVSDVTDLRTALERIADARARFMTLPAKLRRQFDNSPAELYAFLQDPANADEAVELGLLVRPPAPPAPATPAQTPKSDPTPIPS